MNKFKLMILILLIALAAVFGYQNREFMMSTQGLVVDLMVVKLPDLRIQIGLMLTACFVGGYLLAYFFSLLSKFTDMRTIKALSTENRTHLEKIALLESEIVSLKNGSSQAPQNAPEADEEGA